MISQEFDDVTSEERSLDEDYDCSNELHARRCTVKLFIETLNFLQLSKVGRAQRSLQTAYIPLLKLTSESFCNPTDYEKQQLKRGKEMSLRCIWEPPNCGVILLDYVDSNPDDHFYVNFTNVFGALAVKLHEHDIAIEVFKLASKSTVAHTPLHREIKENFEFSVIVAQANIGCVYLIMGNLHQAKENLERALKSLEGLKAEKNSMTVEIDIFATQNNLSLVFRAQKNYPAAIKLQKYLVSRASDLSLPNRMAVALHYNRVELSLELKEPTMALTKLEELKSVSLTMDEENRIPEEYILSKICLVRLTKGEATLAEAVAENLTHSLLSSSLPTSSLSSLPTLSLLSSASSSSSSSSSSSTSSSSSSYASSSSNSASSASSDFQPFVKFDGTLSYYFLVATIENLVDFHLYLKNIESASALLDVLESTCKETFEKGHSKLASLLYRQGVKFSLMGQNESSRHCFEEALNIFAKIGFGSTHPEVEKCNKALGQLFLCDGIQEEISKNSKANTEGLPDGDGPCEETTVFEFSDSNTSSFLFGKFSKQVIKSEEKLGNFSEICMTKNFLKLQGPAIGQIVMWPHERCIKITIQITHPKLSIGKNYDESLPFNCAVIKKALVEEMEICASILGVSFTTYAEKPLCSPLLKISAVVATNSMQSNATARIEANHGGQNSFEDDSDDEEGDAESDTSAPIFPRPRNPENPNTDPSQRSMFVIEDNESISGDELNSESPVLNDQGDFTDGVVNSEVARFQDVIETRDHKKETGEEQLNQRNRESRQVVEVVAMSEKSRDQREMDILKRTNENPSLENNKGNDIFNYVTDCAVTNDSPNYHAISDSGACGYQDNCRLQAVGTTKTCKGDNQRGSSRKGKHTLGLKGGRRDEFASNLSSFGAAQAYIPESSYFGIEPVFLARHTDDDSISMRHNSCCVDEAEEKPPLSFCALPDCQECFPRNTGIASTGVRAVPTQTLFYPNSYQSQQFFSDPYNGKCPCPETDANWNLLLLPPTPFPYLSCDVPQKRYQLAQNGSATGVVQCPTAQFIDRAQGFTPLSRNYTGSGEQNGVMSQTEIQQLAPSVTSTSTKPTAASLHAESSATLERATRQQERERLDGESASATTLPTRESTTVQHISDDDSLAALERRVAEACSLVERVLKEREEREKAMKERERRQREERTQREQRERERREREARQRNQSGEGTSTGSEEEIPSQHAALPERPQWLCEHYQRLCRVQFPCCGRFYPCHRCHNNSDQCGNDNCKAKEAFYIECSICRHQQPINQEAQTCARCKTKMSAYFCSICKHFTGEDKNPYHCTKCGICRIHKDRSFHCDVCNVCLDKRLQGKHKCRPNSGHDECCICLEDAFSGCQILPCSHKVHRECAIAMIQNGVRSCPICRHPLYSQTGGTE